MAEPKDAELEGLASGWRPRTWPGRTPGGGRSGGRPRGARPGDQWGQVQRHPLGRAARQHQASALAVSRADRAEDVGRAVLWFGAAGRVPRLAQRRVILFFCPIRASSANQISTGLPRASAFAISSKWAGKSKSGHRRLALGVMARAG